MHIAGKGLIALIYKELLPINKEKTTRGESRQKIGAGEASLRS